MQHERIAQEENALSTSGVQCNDCGGMLEQDVSVLGKDIKPHNIIVVSTMYSVKNHWLNAFGYGYLCNDCLEVLHDEFSGPPSCIGDESWEDFCDHEDFEYDWLCVLYLINLWIFRGFFYWLINAWYYTPLQIYIFHFILVWIL